MQTLFLRGLILITLICSFAYAEDKGVSETDAKIKEDGLGEQAEAKAEKKSENSSYSGEVFVLRNGAKTEVFFRKHNQSYFIPKGNKHNSIVKILQKKAKLNQMVSIEFNPKTRDIVEVKDAAADAKPSNTSGASQ